ncbi:MAG: metallophosphoesterase, partial [Myxococcota bacterium]
MSDSSVTEPRRVLVVSDMHLGRDCNTITGFLSRRPNPEFDQAFIDLVELYTAGEEAQWRIVFAGDFIDFVEVVVQPDTQDPLHLSFEVNKEELSYGLGTESERSAVKLEATMAYHHQFFRRVADFVAKGGEIVVLRGNHDAELYWDKVQTVFRRTLADLAFEKKRLDVDEAIEIRNDYQTRIQFAPWCYIEPGRLYIEHGHQYDAYCSFDKQLHPVSPTNPRRIDTPLFMFAMRYFVNVMTDFNPHHAGLWTARDYFAWLRNKGPGGAFYVLRMGVTAIGRALWYAAQFVGGRVGVYAHEHHKKLIEEAARFGVPADKLIQIDNLHYTPVTRNLSELARLLFVDRLLLIF